MDPVVADEQIQQALSAKLELQRNAVESEPYPELKVRKDRLQRALDAVINNEKLIVEATQEDFGKRPELSVLLADLLYPVSALRHAIGRVERWMRPEKRKPDFPFNLLGARAYVFYQPLGVVGIMAPWNLPFGLGYAPLAGVLAAGNRAIIKPSELTPHTSAIMAEVTEQAFAPEEVTVVQGGVEVASRFSDLPFDHLIFTGSAPVARQVMRAAADNLTPVTLELGGKAPVIIARGADLEAVASKIVNFKMGNAGQACMGIDHVVVHRSDREAFVDALKRKMAQYFPDYANNPDVCHVFLAKQRQRLAGLVEDAAQLGAQVELIGGDGIEQLPTDPNFPLALLIDPPQDAAVMREEIFGPVLPIVSYDTLEEVVRQVRSRERPLALYFLGGNKEQQDYLLRNTWAGGVTFDDIMLHALTQDLPFGGVGESGMGRYGGHAGFKTFSNAKSVAHPPRINIFKMDPPYTPKMVKTIRGLLKS
jgi:coniferyl-aldehyde dehydrogenase